VDRRRREGRGVEERRDRKVGRKRGMRKREISPPRSFLKVGAC